MELPLSSSLDFSNPSFLFLEISMYPSTATLQNLNLRNLDSHIGWRGYLGQTLAFLPFVPFSSATDQFEYNLANGLSPLSPCNRGATLGQNPVNTLLHTEPFQRFADSLVLDYQDLESARGVDQILQQMRSIKARILRELNEQLFDGDGVAPNLNNLSNRADVTITASSSLTLALLYQLRYSVNPAHSQGLGWGANVWISHPDMLQNLLDLTTSSVGAIQWRFHPQLQVQIPHFLGMPWVVDNNISIAGDKTKIYALNSNHVKILCSVPSSAQADPYGIQVQEIPLQSTISEKGYLVTGVYALQNDPGAIAVLDDVAVP
jgi:hypothetical protein